VVGVTPAGLVALVALLVAGMAGLLGVARSPGLRWAGRILIVVEALLFSGLGLWSWQAAGRAEESHDGMALTTSLALTAIAAALALLCWILLGAQLFLTRRARRRSGDPEGGRPGASAE
jgi:uncharacterized membrane protein YidH (DUF202 family)